jgi:hypothetical protein
MGKSPAPLGKFVPATAKNRHRIPTRPVTNQCACLNGLPPQFRTLPKGNMMISLKVAERWFRLLGASCGRPCPGERSSPLSRVSRDKALII